jgi:hypothetical protein
MIGPKGPREAPAIYASVLAVAIVQQSPQIGCTPASSVAGSDREPPKAAERSHEMLLLVVVVWFILTIPVGIIVGRRIAARRSTEARTLDSAAKSIRRFVRAKLGKSA